ncbi:hypothetical protein QQ045_025683 [Rhodiola kirilowii]
MYSFAQDIDGRKVLNEIIFSPGKIKYRYCKHIANERLPGTTDLMKNGKHFILLRNPFYVLQSYDQVAPPSFLELGYSDLVSIYSELCDLGRPPPIVESIYGTSSYLSSVQGVLRHLCEDLGIPFQCSMLKWEAGSNPADGIWAPMWYKSLHKTTGFAPPRKYHKILPLSDPEPPVPANNKLFVWIGNEILPLEFAKVSVHDSIFQGGGLVSDWLQIHNKKILMLDNHLDRLVQSAEKLAFERVPSRQKIKDAIFTTLTTNGMYHNARVQVTLMPGKNPTFGIISPGCGYDQSRRESTLIVRPEWKPTGSDCAKGVALVTAPTGRRNNDAPGDAIMLDDDGFLSETAAFNLFLVKNGHVLMPQAVHCAPSIAKEIVMSLMTAEGLPVENRRISLSELQNADEAWMIGPMNELKPVIEIDGHLVGNGSIGLITDKIQTGFKNLMEQSGVFIPAN